MSLKKNKKNKKNKEKLRKIEQEKRFEEAKRLEQEKKLKELKQQNRIIKALIVFFLFLIILIIYMNFFIYKTEFFFNGNKEENIKVFNDYNDPGLLFRTGSLYKGYKGLTYKTINNVDTNKIGTYEIIYKLEYKNYKKELKRVVHVIDITNPLIEVTDSIHKKTCEDLKLDYKVYDNYDKDLYDKVIKKVYDDKVILTVEDSSNNKTEKVINIINDKEDNPIIRLNGYSTIYNRIGNKYIEPGYSAFDSCGNNLTSNVLVEGTVNTNKNGTYNVKYKVQSKSGLETIVNRKIVVYTPVVNNNNISEYKTIYLTFDDGPGSYTQSILNTLNSYGVHATFFVTNQFPSYQYMIRKEHESGNAIGIHTYSHQFSIYSSVDTFMNDLNKMNNVIYNQTGKYSNIMRFAGGSSNTVSINYNRGIMTTLSSYVGTKGLTYFDWNVSSGDTVANSKVQVYQNVINNLKIGYSVVLMHDIKYYTMQALPDIINYALANGYTFKTLNQYSPTAHHGISN